MKGMSKLFHKKSNPKQKYKTNFGHTKQIKRNVVPEFAKKGNIFRNNNVNNNTFMTKNYKRIDRQKRYLGDYDGKINIDYHNLHSGDDIFDIMRMLNIRNMSYEQLKDTKVLNLSNTGIARIPKNIWTLDKLEELYLNDNYIEEIPESMILLKNLKVLNLNNNKIEHLEDHFTENLEVLKLDDNWISNIKLTKKYNQLKILNIDCSFMSHFDMNKEGMNNIEELSIKGSLLKLDQNSIFSKKKLRHLSLSGITNLHMTKSTKINPYLKNLKLYDCGLKKLPDHMPLALEQLDITHNKFESIPEAIFELNNLKILNMSHNHHLKNIQFPYRNNSLEEVIFKNCMQLVVNDNTFSNLSNIKKIQV